MAYNVFKGYELLFERLNVDGSPLTSPTIDDVLLIDYPQAVRLARVFEDAVVTKNEGPTGTICQVTKAAKLIGANLGLQLAKLSPKLAYYFEGGTYDNATNKHTPPLYSAAAPPPFSVKAFVGRYDDGKHDIADLAGYLKITCPKCTGTFQEIAADLASIANPSVNIVSEEYIDSVTPGNSKPCYDIDEVALLPSEDDYDVPFKITDASGNVEGAVVSVTVDGTPVTDTSAADGTCELALPLGTHTYSVTKSGYTTKTGEVVVDLVNGLVTVLIVTAG